MLAVPYSFAPGRLAGGPHSTLSSRLRSRPGVAVHGQGALPHSHVSPTSASVFQFINPHCEFSSSSVSRSVLSNSLRPHKL